MEVAPAAHFWNGGVRINERCETSVPGLFAAGEGSASIHGSNRVSGNALTMTQVWGPRAGRNAATYVKGISNKAIDRDQVAHFRNKLLTGFEPKAGSSSITSRNHIRNTAFKNVGVVRNQSGLEEAIAEIPSLYEESRDVSLSCKTTVFNLEWIEAIQNENMITVLEMVARASLMREESRGALYRTDYPSVNNVDWVKHIVIHQIDGNMSLHAEPVDLSINAPKSEIQKYGMKE